MGMNESGLISRPPSLDFRFFDGWSWVSLSSSGGVVTPVKGVNGVKPTDHIRRIYLYGWPALSWHTAVASSMGIYFWW